MLTFFVLLLIKSTLLTQSFISPQSLRTIRVQMGNHDGDGMDGGFLRNMNWGGGRFDFKLCQVETSYCCQTGNLNTDDDNWEKGEVNYFIGRQIGGCQDFDLNITSPLELTVQHRGNDGGRIAFVDLWTSERDRGIHYRCDVNVKLDHDLKAVKSCFKVQTNGNGFEADCNGHPDFCQAKFNEFMFAGAHNAATGKRSQLIFDCHAVNQDLTFVEMLDFGLRFFDIDTELKGNELLAVHGPLEFGKVKYAMVDIKHWLNRHPNEIIVLYFGDAIKGDLQAQRELKSILEMTFNGLDGNVGLNDEWLTSHTWPTLGEAKATNKRVFAFVRVESQAEIDALGDKIIAENQIKRGSTAQDFQGAVTILSSYDKLDSCSSIENGVEEACKHAPEAEFAKLAIFGSYPGDSPTACLSTHARTCNSRIQQSIDACKKHRSFVNFLQSDYPNHPGPGKKTSVEIAHAENLKLYSS